MNKNPIGQFLLLLLLLGGCSLLGNPLQPIVAEALAKDSRNAGLEFQVSPSGPDASIDLVKISDSNSLADVFRCFLTSAQALQDKHFEKVHLKRNGEEKFVIDGSYFTTLGVEYGRQNVIYTMRTLPEHLHDPAGQQAFQTWTGGLLGVTGKQMEDFNQAMKDWVGI